jgi:trehalose 6-phosphate phosphatase
VASTVEALLEHLTSDPEEAALFLDFDGVLAPIVPRPEDAAVPAQTLAEVERLADRYGLVAVVSGRDGDDVRSRVGLDGVAYVGSHGLELNPEAEHWTQRLRDFAGEVPWETEPKRLTLSFHYRDAPDEQEAVKTLEAVAERAREQGFVARFGRKVLEVLPPLAGDKGTAVRHLLADRGLTRALVAGDDTTDLDAFRALDDLDRPVRVAVASPESPSALTDAAEIVVASPAEFLELLKRL